jgi:hypothetical protein
MAELVFKIGKAFTIRGRGVVVCPGPWGTGRAKRGDSIELRRPDGTVVRATVEAVTYPDTGILLPKHLSKKDVPIGTEVWTAESLDAETNGR